jgi:hypothetical protein
VGGSTGGGRRGGGGGGFPGSGGPPPPPNFAALQGTMVRQLGTLDSGDMAPNEPMTRAYAAACNDLKTAVTKWVRGTLIIPESGRPVEQVLHR